MGDFLIENDLQQIGALRVSGTLEFGDHRRRHVEAAGLQHHGHHGEAGEGIHRRFRRRLPEPVMRRQIAIVDAERVEARLQHGEMARLVIRHANPVVEKSRRPIIGSTEPADQIPGEIDGVELDMGDGVEQGDAPAQTAGAAARHMARREQARGFGPRRACRHCHGTVHRR